MSFSRRSAVTLLALSLGTSLADASEIIIEFSGVFSECQFAAPVDCAPLTGTAFSGRLSFIPEGVDYDPLENGGHYIASDTKARLTLETVLPEANAMGDAATIFVDNDFGGSALPDFAYYDFFTLGGNLGTAILILGAGSQTLPVEVLSDGALPTVTELQAMPLSHLQVSFGDRTALAEGLSVRVFHGRAARQVPLTNPVFTLWLFGGLVLVGCRVLAPASTSQLRARAPNKKVNRTYHSGPTSSGSAIFASGRPAVKRRLPWR